MKVKDIAELNYSKQFRVDLCEVKQRLEYIRTERGAYDELSTDALDAEVYYIDAFRDTIWLSAVRGYNNA